MYSKAQQLGKRFKPKQKDRTKIREKDYHKMIDIWGAYCIFCGNPSIEAHHVRFRAKGGKGRYTNLLPLCQDHHRDAHTYNSIRKTLEYKLEQTFGVNYWMDEWDLYERGLIDHPTVGEYEKYFGGVRE